MSRLVCILVGSFLAVTVAPAQKLLAGAQEGLPAPAFSVRPVNGRAVSLDDLVDPNGGLIALADPRNRDGRRLLTYLEQSKARLEEMEVGLLVFAIGYSVRGSVAQLVKQNNLTVPVTYDPNGRYAQLFGVEASATALVVDPDKKVVRRYDATVDGLDLGPLAMGGVRDMLEALAAERDTGEEVPAGEGEASAAGETTSVEGAAPVAKLPQDQVRRRIRSGWRLIQTGHTSAALKDARALATQQGRDFLSTLWLAYALEAARLYPEAAVTYREVLKLKPGHRYSLQAIARIDPTGRFQSAADLPQAETAKEPSDDEAATSSEGPAAVGG